MKPIWIVLASTKADVREALLNEKIKIESQGKECRLLRSQNKLIVNGTEIWGITPKQALRRLDGLSISRLIVDESILRDWSHNREEIIKSIDRIGLSKGMVEWQH